MHVQASTDLDETLYHQSTPLMDWITSSKYPSLVRKERLVQMQAAARGAVQDADQRTALDSVSADTVATAGGQRQGSLRTQLDTASSLDAADVPSSLKGQSFRMEPMAL
jgi:sorbitol-specific phosphotransferase system component IIBC